MSVKRFVAADMRRALELVRQELGPNAVILSSKRTKGGVEILTSDEADYRAGPSQQTALAEAAAAAQAFATQRDEPATGFGAQPSPVAASPSSYQPELPREPERPTAPAVSAADRYQLRDLDHDSAAVAQTRRRGAADPVAADTAGASATSPSASPTQPYAPAVAAPKVEPLGNLQLGRWQYEPGVTNVSFALDAFQQAAPGNADDGLLDDFIDDQFNELRSEILGMRELLQSQISQLSQAQRQSLNAAPVSQANLKVVPSSVKVTVERRLRQLGLAAAQVSSCLAAINTDGKLTEVWSAALSHLASQLPVQHRDLVDKGGVFALVGNPGSGKTAALGKLAARYVLKRGPGDLAIVTTAAQSANERQRLQRLAGILGVAIHHAGPGQSLAGLLERLQDKALVLIDTAGADANRAGARAVLAELRQLAGVRTLLVMAADTPAKAAASLMKSFRALQPRGCIVTKLDQCQSIAALISQLLNGALPVAYVAKGESMPQDIALADPRQLLAKAVAGLKAATPRGKRPSSGRGTPTNVLQPVDQRGVALS